MSFADELRKNTKSQETVMKEKQEAAEKQRKSDYENAKNKTIYACRIAADEGKRTAEVFVGKVDAKWNFWGSRIVKFDPDNYVRNIYRDVCNELGLTIKKFDFYHESYDGSNSGYVIIKW